MPEAPLHVQAATIVALKEHAITDRRIVTAPSSITQVLFADGTTLTLGMNSAAIIDSFQFDPVSRAAKLLATLEQGVFRFVGGRTSKTRSGVTLTTPFGCVIIENAGAELSLGGDGYPAHFDLLFGDSLRLEQSGSVAVHAHREGYSIIPGDGARVRRTPHEWKSAVLDRLSVRSRLQQ